MRHDAWFLTPAERENPATSLDRRHATAQGHETTQQHASARGQETAWSTGNRVEALVHGSTYFARLRACIAELGAGDLLLFTDWRGDPDQRFDDAGTTAAAALCHAAERGVVVNGLIWRSHWDKLAFSAAENRRLGSEIEAAGGCCLLDMRVRVGGSHHQKFVVLRRGSGDGVAFVGGIDLCHSRRDDAAHGGDAQRQSMAAVYGDRPPWHDLQLMLHGPAVGDVEHVFRERWDDPQPLSRAPWRRVANRLRGEGTVARRLPAQQPDPPPCGPHAVQLLRTYADLRHGYPFAPDGERSVARGFGKALDRARALIYVEDQYLWSREIVSAFADALRRNVGLRMVAVVPRFPDQDGKISRPPNDVGRLDAMQTLRDAGGERVAIYDVENRAGVPIYVHAKVCVIDDVWACVGSANINRRSWSHDSELSCAVIDDTLDERVPRDPGGLGDGARVFARDLRLALAREHLGRDTAGSGRPTAGTRHDDADHDDADLLDPVGFFDALADAAENLDRWYLDGKTGTRPPGGLRPHRGVRLDRVSQAWARPLYRVIYDPDGRPWGLRRRESF